MGAGRQWRRKAVPQLLNAAAIKLSGNRISSKSDKWNMQNKSLDKRAVNMKIIKKKSSQDTLFSNMHLPSFNIENGISILSKYFLSVLMLFDAFQKFM